MTETLVSPPVTAPDTAHDRRAVLRGVLVAVIAVVLLAPYVMPLLTGRHLLVVDGGSMEPTLHRGDVLVTRLPVARDLRLGDVLVAQTATGRYTHRVVGVEDGGRRLRLQGDANAVPDPTWVDRDEIVAVPVATISGAAAWVVRAVSSLLGSVLLVACLAALLLRPPRWRPRRTQVRRCRVR